MEFSAKVRTCLWFARDGHAAAAFYVSLLPDSRIETEVRPDPAEPPLVVEFRLAGAPYMILNGGAMYEPSPAASISVLTEDQGETDRLWAALIADGGAAGRCGWLVDRWGVSWQIVPKALPRLLVQGGPGAERVQQAMLAMAKIDIAALEAAFQG